LGEVVPLSRADIDLARTETIAPALAAHQPDIFVNCAAYNFVDKAETEGEAAFTVNGSYIAFACNDAGVRLVQFSTDYVFGRDATRATPYTEGDWADPISTYGWSKFAGEQVAWMFSRNLVIRTCGLYGVWGSGGKGGNFVETMLRLAGQGK